MSDLIYGFHPIVEAIRSGKSVDKVYFQQGITGEIEKEIRHLTKAHNIALQVVPKDRLNKLVKGNHQGVVAWLTSITYQKLEDVLPLIYENGEIPLILILDHVTDVRNFGAIVRTALCSGVHAIVVPASGAAPANEEAMKASAGALAKATICKENSLFNAVMLLQDSGVQVLATALSPRAIRVWDADLTQPTAIIMGAEGDGIHPKLLKMADKTIIIPQLGDFDSYNVGVATGIALYEVGRQRVLSA